MAEKNTIAKMREATWNGVIDQNGYNKHFYNLYDDEGRIVGSQQGIQTVPAELAPRERFVERNLEGFQPRADFSEEVKHAQTVKAFIPVVGKEPGETLTVNKQVGRVHGTRGEAGKAN
jgi:hypothetical protein